MNALVDPEIIEALYEASQAGVQIDLIVRGICCLRPGLPGVSERIRVISIVGRFLEHSRASSTSRTAATTEVFIGSADWMPRNFDRRVEAAAPVEDADAPPDVMRDLCELMWQDNRQAWDLDARRHLRTAPGAGRGSPSARRRRSSSELARAGSAATAG